MYIYKAIKLDCWYIPPLREVVAEFPTQAEAISFLQDNGGGIMCDILANVDVEILAVETT